LLGPARKGDEMTPRQRNPEATKEALIQAAEAILMEKGFGNTSLSEIANRAGITKSLIHHYFGSKEGLLREVKTRRFTHYAEQQAEMLKNTKPSAELLRASVAFYFDFLRRNPQIVRILAWMFLEQDRDECFEMDRELIRQGVAKVRETQAAGQLRSDIDPKFIIFIFVGLCQNWFQDKDHFKESFGTEGISGDLDEAYLSNMIKIFFEGILPR
jgi:TetR/AcrR family transcriptional regulator